MALEEACLHYCVRVSCVLKCSWFLKNSSCVCLTGSVLASAFTLKYYPIPHWIWSVIHFNCYTLRIWQRFPELRATFNPRNFDISLEISFYSFLQSNCRNTPLTLLMVVFDSIYVIKKCSSVKKNLLNVSFQCWERQIFMHNVRVAEIMADIVWNLC